MLAIGGLKEKTMAAMRNGIATVILPKENLKDLTEIDPVVRETLRFVSAESVDTVLAEALYPAEPEVKEPVITAFMPMDNAVQEAGIRQ